MAVKLLDGGRNGQSMERCSISTLKGSAVIAQGMPSS
jgi:hypothetical protein